MIPGKVYTPELILQIIWRRKWWIVLPAVAIAVAVVAWTRTLTDLYRSDAVILVVPQQVPEAYVKSTVTATVQDRLQSISQQILSRTRLERIILDLGLFERQRRTGIMEDIIDQMRSKIEVQTVKGDAFRVSFTSEDPRTAMKVAERLGSLFIDESLRDRETLAEGTSQFLEAQLEDARRQLVDNEKKLENYRRSHGGELPAQLESNMQGLHNTEMQIQTLVDSMNRDRDRYDGLKLMIADLEANAFMVAPPTGAATVIETAADKLRAAQAQLASLEQRMRPTHPDIIRAKKVIADLQKAADEEAANQPLSAGDTPVTPLERLRRTRLNDANRDLANLTKDIASKTAEEKRLREVLAGYQRRIEVTPTRESELTELTRDYGTLQAMYTGLLQKKQESQISANLERRQIGEQFRILDPARVPARPFTPNRPQYYGMGIVGGLIVGVGLALVLEYLDRSMRNDDDVRVAVGINVLAAIPLIQARVSKKRRVLIAFVSATAAVAVGVGVFVTLRYLR